ncbi:MAG: hypothetical protein AAGK71_03105 [Pseudomonadota bacterium]
MPLIALISLGAAFAGAVYLKDERPEVRRLAKLGLVIGALGATVAAMATLGPMAALILFAAFVAFAIFNKVWK